MEELGHVSQVAPAYAGSFGAEGVPQNPGLEDAIPLGLNVGVAFTKNKTGGALLPRLFVIKPLCQLTE
jgi:hypothetical protein